jgi:hypothetical protein
MYTKFDCLPLSLTGNLNILNVNAIILYYIIGIPGSNIYIRYTGRKMV